MIDPCNEAKYVGYMPNPEKMKGRVEFKPETDGKRAYYRGVITISRNYKNADGQYETDFLPFEAWGQTANYINEHVMPGDIFAIVGPIHQGKAYTTNSGETKYTSDRMVVDTVRVISHKNATGQASAPEATPAPKVKKSNPFSAR